MSGVPGVFHRTGRPLDPRVLRRMIAATPHRHSSGALLNEDGPVAMVCHARTDDGLAITFDGRLDNRDELIAALEHHEAPLHGASDAGLVLAAYRRWSDACPAKLIGDFAFAIWDASRRAVFCARDPTGIKPFYYAVDEHTFVWGSDLAQLFASGCVERKPNEGMVAEYLAFAIRSQAETLYRGVMRLPAAHTLTVTPERVRTTTYWQLDPTIELSYRSDGEYAEHFFELFQEAVRCRVPHDGRVAAYLSGGLDSSSVVAMARSLGHDVETFSLLFPNIPEADEHRYIDDVVDRWRLAAHKLEARPVDGAVCRAHVERRFDVPDLPSDLVGEDLLALLQGGDRHVVLTGIGGDYGFGGSAYHYADMLQTGDVRGLGQQFAADARLFGVGSSLWEVLMSGVRPLLPAPLKSAVRPLARQFGLVPHVPEWVNDDLARATGLADRLRPPVSADRCMPSRRHIWDLFAAGWPYIILERNERSAAEYGVDERHPFLDRRLVEFALAIPESQRWRGDRTKYVLRQAMRTLLPDSVYTRLDKGDFSSCVPLAVDAIGGAALLDNLHIASVGWVRQDRISEMYRESRRLFAERTETYCPLSFRLWMVAGIELWYRTMFLNEESHGRVQAVAEAVAG